MTEKRPTGPFMAAVTSAAFQGVRQEVVDNFKFKIKNQYYELFSALEEVRDQGYKVNATFYAQTIEKAGNFVGRGHIVVSPRHGEKGAPIVLRFSDDIEYQVDNKKARRNETNPGQPLFIISGQITHALLASDPSIKNIDGHKNGPSLGAIQVSRPESVLHVFKLIMTQKKMIEIQQKRAARQRRSSLK